MFVWVDVCASRWGGGRGWGSRRAARAARARRCGRAARCMGAAAPHFMQVWCHGLQHNQLLGPYQPFYYGPRRGASSQLPSTLRSCLSL